MRNKSIHDEDMGEIVTIKIRRGALDLMLTDMREAEIILSGNMKNPMLANYFLMYRMNLPMMIHPNDCQCGHLIGKSGKCCHDQ